MAYCNRCERFFPSEHSYKQHIADSSRHNICKACNKDFETRDHRRQHYIQSPRHPYCRECNTHFPTRGKLIDHCRAAHSGYWCATCDQFFDSPVGLHEHYRQSHTHTLFPHYCFECQQRFGSESNLRAHLNSSIHKPRNVHCEAPGCAQSFVSKSGLILHLESGSCQSGIDRFMVNELIREADQRDFITEPRDDGSYTCPLSNCRRTFPKLSSLCQHVESESCGVLRLVPLRQRWDRLMRDFLRRTSEM